MQHDRVLLVEDNDAIHTVVAAALKATCEVAWTATLGDAKRQLDTSTFHLVLLDVHLPDGDGFAFCAQLRADPRYRDLPIIFLTGETDVDKRVHGFELGGDDYITKPFAPAELAARVHARLRAVKTPRDQFRVDRFSIDLTRQRATLHEDDVARDLPLTPIEFKLLAQFLKHIDVVLSREVLITAVWGEDVHVGPHTIDTHISSLRRKIGAHGDRLNAVVKRGYCFRGVSTQGNRSAG